MPFNRHKKNTLHGSNTVLQKAQIEKEKRIVGGKPQFFFYAVRQREGMKRRMGLYPIGFLCDLEGGRADRCTTDIFCITPDTRNL